MKTLSIHITLVIPIVQEPFNMYHKLDKKWVNDLFNIVSHSVYVIVQGLSSVAQNASKGSSAISRSNNRLMLIYNTAHNL